MFEGVVADLLNRYLGKYVENLDSENLRIGIWNGKVELKNLKIKSSALFELNLPIEVKAGHIGCITLQIPWTNLYNSRVQCLVEDVYIISGPITDRPYDPDREEELKNAIKRQILEQLEDRGEVTSLEDDDDEEKWNVQTFMQRLTATVVNNIQVTLKRLHIRYEEHGGVGEGYGRDQSGFACGVMLAELTALTVNESWEPQQLDSAAEIVRKLVQMKSLSVYWNAVLAEENLLRNKLHSTAWITQLEKSITTYSILQEDFEFILREISAHLKLTLNRNGGDSESYPEPLVSVEFCMNELDAMISRHQYLGILSTQESLQMMSINQRYQRFRPNSAIHGNSRLFWKYAYTAVCEDYIRPYSWIRIQQHRKLYREYKDVYKKYLSNNSDDNGIKKQMELLENELDVANVIMAREHAKIEYCAEAPDKAAKKQKDKKPQGWLSWLLSADDDDDDDDEFALTVPDKICKHSSNLPAWLSNLNPEEQKKLSDAIGYSDNSRNGFSSEYIGYRLSFYLGSLSLSLMKYGKEVMRSSVTRMQFLLESRLENNGFRITAKTESIEVEGLSIEQELVHVVTSLIDRPAQESAVQVLSIEFEKCLPGAKSDFKAIVNVQPVEIVHDEHAVKETISFFRSPHLGVQDITAAAQEKLSRLVVVSRAGLQHAINQHKTIDLMVNISSPYFVVPEYGTMHRGGNLVIVDLGRLKIESELQPRDAVLEECTMSEIESRLYDKFSITVSQIKILLADSGDDWHTARKQADSRFHILPSVGLNISFFNSVKAKFTQLPRHKLESKLMTMKVNLSDEKLKTLFRFIHQMSQPSRSNSMMGMEDSVDGRIETTLFTVNCVKVPPVETIKTLRRIKRSVHRNSALKTKVEASAHDEIDGTAVSERMSASTPPVLEESSGDWSKGIDSHVGVMDVDSLSRTNGVVSLWRFVVGEVVVQVWRGEERREVAYLMMRVDRVCLDVVMTTYGLVSNAHVGGVCLVDKVHLGPSGEYLEIIGFKSQTEFMSLLYRQVSPSCPEFNTVYKGLEQDVVGKISLLKVNLEKKATVYLSAFIQDLLNSFRSSVLSQKRSLGKSCSTLLSQTLESPAEEGPSSFLEKFAFTDIRKQTSQKDVRTSVCEDVTKLEAVLHLSDLTVRLSDGDIELADVCIKGLEGRINVCSGVVICETKLNDLFIEDLSENTLYPKILSLDDDSAFELKITLPVKDSAKQKLGVTVQSPVMNSSMNPSSTNKAPASATTAAVDGKIELKIGRIQAVVINKFISEIKNFIQPFTSQELMDSYKVAAQSAVYNAIQEMHDEGNLYNISVTVHAPILLIPQHLLSSSVLMLRCGNLTASNCLTETDIGQGVIQKWDHISIKLDSTHLIRGKLNMSGNVEPIHDLVDPINVNIELKRALPPHHTDLHYDLSGKIKLVQMRLTDKDVRALMFIVRDNLNEESSRRPDVLDIVDSVKPRGARPPDLIPPNALAVGEGAHSLGSTPIIEVEEPLLEAAEVLELVMQTKLCVEVEGIVLTLATEDTGQTDGLSSPGGTDDAVGLMKLNVGRCLVEARLDTTGPSEAKLALDSLTVIDIRPHSDLAVKQIMRSGLYDSVASARAPPMIELSYRHSAAENNSQISANIDSVRFNMCANYVLSVIGFFVVPLTQFGSCSTTAKPNTNSSHRTAGHVTGSSDSSDLDSSPEGVTLEGQGHQFPSSVTRKDTITAVFRLKTLDVVVFSDPTIKNSSVLVMRLSARCDSFKLQNKEHFDAKIQLHHIVSCVYGNTLNTTSVVLQPCSIDLSSDHDSSNVSVSPRNICVKVTDITARIQPIVFHILKKVLSDAYDTLNEKFKSDDSTVNGLSGAGEMSGEYGAGVKTDMKDIWNVKKITADRLLNLNEEDNHRTHPSIRFPSSDAVPLTLYIMSMPSLVVIVENESCCPGIKMIASFDMEYRQFDFPKLDAVGTVELEINYYNDVLCVWEPLLEKVMSTTSNGCSYKPWSCTFKLTRGPSHRIKLSNITEGLPGQTPAQGGDEVDGVAVKSSNQERSTQRQAEDESSSEVDEENDGSTEMLIIKPNHSVGKQGSRNSAQYVTRRRHHSSVSSHDIQGDSDSEPDVISDMSSKLAILLHDDDDDDTGDDDDVPDLNDDGDTTGDNLTDGGADDNVDAVEMPPIFLTSKGPVWAASDVVKSGDGMDVVDGNTVTSEQTVKSVCMYYVLESRDDLLLNVTPTAVRILTDLSESITNNSSQPSNCENNLPSFQLFNDLGVSVKISLSPDIKVYDEDLHNVEVESVSVSQPLGRDRKMSAADDSDQLIDVNDDDLDGLKNLNSYLSSTMPTRTLCHSLSTASLGSVDIPVSEADEKMRPGSETVDIKLNDCEKVYGLSCKKSVRKLVPMNTNKEDGEKCYIVFESRTDRGRKVVTLRSPLKIYNGLSVPVQLFSCEADNSAADTDEIHFTPIAVIEASQSLHVPLHVVFHCSLHFAPANMLYEKTSSAIWWREMTTVNERVRQYTCQPQPPNTAAFYFTALLEPDTPTLPVSNSKKSRTYGQSSFTLSLHAPLHFHNLLPLTMHYSIGDGAVTDLSQGENVSIHTVDLSQRPKLHLQVMNYLGVDWTGTFELTNYAEEFKAVSMAVDGGHSVKGQLSLTLRIDRSKDSSVHVYVFSPYWIVNKTGLPIEFRGSRNEIVYEVDSSDEPLLFRFKKNQRKKAKLRVYSSSWTQAVCLDTVGTSGVVVCNSKERNKKYQFLLNIQMSSLNLTKIVSILPYYVVINSIQQQIRYMEENEEADLWFDIGPGECVPFWPSSNSQRMCVKYRDSSVCSQQFSFSTPHSTVLRMDRGTALKVDVTMPNNSIVIKLRPFCEGDIPVRVDNFCDDVFIKLHQKNMSQVTLLSPCQSVLYTWDDPSAERTLLWNVYNRKKLSYPAFFAKDGNGEVRLSIHTVRRSSATFKLISTNALSSKSKKVIEPEENGSVLDKEDDDTTDPREKGFIQRQKKKLAKCETMSPYDSSPEDDSDIDTHPENTKLFLRQNTRTDKVIIYWVSYMEGLQRVFLLTQNQTLALKATIFRESEMATSSLFLSLSGSIGVSVINSLYEEVSYVSLTSSSAVWQVRSAKSRYFKTLSLEVTAWLEEQFRMNKSKISLDDMIVVDLRNMKMIKPLEGDLCRTFRPAVWLQYQQSESNSYLHLQVHRFQIDNQLNDAYYTTVLYPSACKNIKQSRRNSMRANSSGHCTEIHPPFIELITTKTNVKQYQIDNWKYMKLLIQEFNLQLDKGFVLSLHDVYTKSLKSEQKENFLLGRDILTTKRSLRENLDPDVNQSGVTNQQMTFEFIHLSPLQMIVSLSMDGAAHVTRDEGSVAADAIEFLLSSVGAKFTDMRNVELRMAYFERIGSRMSVSQLMCEVGSHYSNQALQQFYVLLLGLDVLGNPYGLIKDFTKGLQDFFYEPIVSTIHQPDKFAENLGRGLRSLLGHTVGGVANSVSTLSGSVGKTLAFFTFDEDYQKRRYQRMRRQQMSEDLGESLSLAGAGFLSALSIGLSGIIVLPVRGAREEGVEGFFKGIGRGIMGLFLKPSSGIVDLVTVATDAIRRAAEMGEGVVYRVRLPRNVNSYLGLKCYSRHEAMGRSILMRVEEDYNQTDIYWAHSALSPNHDDSNVLLITNMRLLLLTQHKGAEKWSVIWVIQFSDMIGCPDIQGKKLVIRTKKDEQLTNWFGGTLWDVECANEQLSVWLHDKIDSALYL